MSDRHKPHFGRDRAGQRKVRREDVEDKVADVHGEEYLRDEVRLGGAVEDVGPAGGQAGREIESLVEGNREDVGKTVGAPPDGSRGRPPRSRRAR
jgi:hypothetical protein